MSERLEARIVVQALSRGLHEITVVDPRTGREVKTGLLVTPGEVDREVRKLKTTLERAGNQVSVKVM